MTSIIESAVLQSLRSLRSPFKAKHQWSVSEPNSEKLDMQYRSFLEALLVIKLQLRYNLNNTQVQKLLYRIAEYQFKDIDIVEDWKSVRLEAINIAHRDFYQMLMHIATTNTESVEVNGNLFLFEDMLSNLYFNEGNYNNHDYFNIFVTEFLNLKNDFFKQFELIDNQLNNLIFEHVGKFDAEFANIIEITKTPELNLDLNSIRIYEGKETTVNILKLCGWSDIEIEKYSSAKVLD